MHDLTADAHNAANPIKLIRSRPLLCMLTLCHCVRLFRLCSEKGGGSLTNNSCLTREALKVIDECYTLQTTILTHNGVSFRRINTVDSGNARAQVLPFQGYTWIRL